MKISPVQFNINAKAKEYKNYLEAEGAVETTDLVKPLPGKGHLIHDDLVSKPVYFVKDIAYDMKSVKDGVKGNANDHQLGRLNDVGLQVGGVGIATYLASKTTNPKSRIMEYAGLAAFLTAMNIYPKIAINAPSKLLHGYDIGTWYIDDQGRKKSVNQDSNYRPMDLYRGDAKGETLDEIGDKMGIPRDIKNRHEVIKEQTRKNSTQSNTLWMLTAGFATPLMTALGCYGLENYVIAPQLEKTRNSKYNKLISKMLDKTKVMEIETDKIQENNLSKKISSILSKFENKPILKEDFDNILNMMTKNIEPTAAEALKKDIANVLQSSIVVDGEITEKMAIAGKTNISKDKKALLEDVLVPTRHEIQEAIKKVNADIDFVKGGAISTEDIFKIEMAIDDLIDLKIENAYNTLEGDALRRFKRVPEEYLADLKVSIVDSMSAVMQSNKAKVGTKENLTKLTNVAKILGEFVDNKLNLDKCSNFKVEKAPETVLARYYDKFEKTLLKELKITEKEMLQMRDSEAFTQELLDKKLSELAGNESRYEKTFKKLSKIISEMEIALHGTSAEKSDILDLIQGIENNYNNTAKRLAKLGGFNDSITKLVNQDANTLGNSLHSRAELFDWLDGVVQDRYKVNGPDGSYEGLSAYARYNSEGRACAKYHKISRIVERYQGVKNSFNRILHSMEVYKRTTSENVFLDSLNGLTGMHKPLSRTDSNYLQTLIKKVRSFALKATSTDHYLKFNIKHDAMLYRDIMNSLFPPAENADFWAAKSESFVTESAKNAMNTVKEHGNGGLIERFSYYLTRCRNLLANNMTDFTKPRHSTNQALNNSYTMSEKTDKALFELISQDPINFFKGASKRDIGTNKWFKTVSMTTAGVFAVTLLAQFGFGKLKNSHNIKKQVNNESAK